MELARCVGMVPNACSVISVLLCFFNAQQCAAVQSNALAMKQHRLYVALLVDRAERGVRGGEGGMEQWHWW